jgi:hypothetical protein
MSRIISIKSVINSAKFTLGLESTTHADAWLEKLINEAAIHTNKLDNYFVSCETVDIDCARAKLPENFMDLICFSFPNVSGCSGCCSINHDPEGDSSQNMLCGCSQYFVRDRAVLSEFCGLGATACFAGNYFDTQNGYLSFPSTITATEVRLWYRGLNEDENGLMVITEIQERGLAAYAAYKYALRHSSPPMAKYTPFQVREYKTEWANQKGWVTGMAQQTDFQAHKAAFAAIAKAIIIDPWTIVDTNY